MAASVCTHLQTKTSIFRVLSLECHRILQIEFKVISLLLIRRPHKHFGLFDPYVLKVGAKKNML
jgi:hypothetical protein